MNHQALFRAAAFASTLALAACGGGNSEVAAETSTAADGTGGTVAATTGNATDAGSSAGTTGTSTGTGTANAGASTSSNTDASGGAAASTGSTKVAVTSPAVAASTCDGVGSSTPKTPGATLVLRVDGAEPGVSYDVLQVDGRARLGGTLQLVFADSFSPTKGQRFKVVQAACLAGTFDSITANKGVTLAAAQDATSLTLTVQ